MLILGTIHTLQVAVLGLLTSASAPGGPPEFARAPEAAAIDRQDVYIEDIEASGPGCPTGTVSSVVASNRRSFLVSYQRMVLKNPSASGETLQHTNCASVVTLHVPSGFQVTVATVNARGYAYLPPGIRARQTFDYTFADVPTALTSNHDLAGDFDGHYVFTDRFPFGKSSWSSCGGSVRFTIDSQLQLDATANPTGHAYLNTIATDGRFNLRYHLRWREC